MFRRIWDELSSGKNLDSYLSIGIAIVVTVLDVFEIISDQIVQNAVLLVLALILLGRVADRWFFEEVSQKLLGPEFTTWEDLRKEVKLSLLDSKAIWILGVAPLGFIREYHDELQKICRRGGKVWVLFVKPDSASMKLISSRYPEQPGDAQALLEEVRKLKISLGNNANQLQVRCFDYVPHCIVTKVDKGGREVAFVTMNGIGKLGNQRITFFVPESRPQSLAYFTKEIKVLWEMGENCKRLFVSNKRGRLLGPPLSFTQARNLRNK